MKNNLSAKQSDFLLYTGSDGKVNVEVFIKNGHSIALFLQRFLRHLRWAGSKGRDYLIRLDQQLFDTFVSSSSLLGQPPVQAESREHLKSLLRVASGGIVFTTIQKFFPENDRAFKAFCAGRSA